MSDEESVGATGEKCTISQYPQKGRLPTLPRQAGQFVGLQPFWMASRLTNDRKQRKKV